MTDQEFDQQKQVAYYAATVAAFTNVRMELDKSVLALSAGGIGLVVTLMTTVGASSVSILTLDILSIAAFLVAIFVSLVIFSVGADQMRAVAQGKEEPSGKWLDYVARSTFAVGVVLACVAGGLAGYAKIPKGDAEMTNSNKGNPAEQVQKSLTGFSGLAPKPAPAPAAAVPAPAAPTNPALTPPAAAK